MDLAANTYLPVLRWKEAERMALAQLDGDVRRRIAPIVEFIPKEFDVAALATCSAKAATQLAQTSGWGPEKPVLMDFHLLGDEIATRVVGFVSQKVKSHKVNASLVTGLFRSSGFQEAVKSASRANNFDICFRVYPHQLRQAGFSAVVRETLDALGVDPRKVHLLLDFAAISDTRPNLAPRLDTLSNIAKWRSVSVLLGAFPKDLANVEKNTQQVMPRFDWLAWREFVSEHPIAAPFFGDYTIQHGIYEDHEGQHFNFSASIRYTSEEGWVIMRGEGVLTEDGPGYAQWPANAQLLCGREEFNGGDYCVGDRYIENMSRQVSQTGTAKEWLAAGMNHHITFVVRQIMREFSTAAEAKGVVKNDAREET